MRMIQKPHFVPYFVHDCWRCQQNEHAYLPVEPIFVPLSLEPLHHTTAELYQSDFKIARQIDTHSSHGLEGNRYRQQEPYRWALELGVNGDSSKIEL